MPTAPRPRQGSPARALALSLAALAVPVVAGVAAPETADVWGDLPWILALVPALLLSSLRGWQVISVALALGMVALAALVTVGHVIDRDITSGPLVLFVIAPYIAIALGAGWFSDVTRQQRLTLDAQRSADERIRRFAEASFEAIVIHDKGTLLDANATFARLFGYEPVEIPGMHFMTLATEESRELLAAKMNEAAAGSFEAVGRRKDGSTFIAELRGGALSYDGGLVAVVTVRDITQRRRAEDALRRLERALETMQLGVTMTDLEGRITYVNPADATMHGYAVDELVGRPASIYALPVIRRPLSETHLRKLSSWQRESTNMRKDGGTFPVMLRSDVIESSDGQVVGVVTTCEDITERKATEEELKKASGSLRKSGADLLVFQEALIEAEKMESVGRLAAGVAHEVKNPLMTLLTGVKFLSMHLGSRDEKISGLLTDMADAVARADTVIKGLLDFAAPRKLDLTSNDLNAIVERSLDMMKHEIAKGQIAVVSELAPDIPPLLLDPFKLQQVLLNLVTNAVHATPPGGRITVRTFVHARAEVGVPADGNVGPRRTIDMPSVFLEVDDTGTGIALHAETKIFDPFFTTKPAGQGTGLGLSVSRQIVHMHGGELDIRNRSGGGVRATIVFKLFTEDRTNGQEAHPAG